MANGLPWIPWDVGYYNNPKARAAGKNGRALHHAASLFAGDNLTDGVIRPTDLALICAQAEVPKSTVNVCVREGLFHVLPNNEGWLINDFLPRNKSRAEVEEQRAKWAEKKARQRGVSPGDTPETPPGVPPLRQTDRQTVRSEYISDDDDSVDTGQPSSSSISEGRQTGREAIAMATARTLAASRTDLTNRRAWIDRTAKGLIAERSDDLDRCIDAGLSMEASVTMLTTVPAEPDKPTRAAWYANPNCNTCPGDGWIMGDLSRLVPCACQRHEPYVATVHPIRPETA